MGNEKLLTTESSKADDCLQDCNCALRERTLVRRLWSVVEVVGGVIGKRINPAGFIVDSTENRVVDVQ